MEQAKKKVTQVLKILTNLLLNESKKSTRLNFPPNLFLELYKKASNSTAQFA